MTLKQAYDCFLQNGRSYWSPSTSVYYKRNVFYFVQYAENILNDRADHIPVDELPRDILMQYVVWLRSKSRR